MIDSHAHIEGDEFSDREEVLARARAAGIDTIICVGSGRDITSARQAVTLAHQHSDLFATVGIHPHDARSLTNEVYESLRQLARDPRVVGIGETGLDYYYDHSPRDVQQQAFRRHIALAREANKPLVLHVRDAHEDTRAILDDEGAANVGAIVHCFTGTRDDAQAYLARGCYISFSGIVTFRNAHELRAAAAIIPEDRLLVETDCPYLAPEPMRGKRNEPAFVVHTVEAIARVRGSSATEVGATTARATRRAFRLNTAEPS